RRRAVADRARRASLHQRKDGEEPPDVDLPEAGQPRSHAGGPAGSPHGHHPPGLTHIPDALRMGRKSYSGGSASRRSIEGQRKQGLVPTHSMGVTKNEPPRHLYLPADSF